MWLNFQLKFQFVFVFYFSCTNSLPALRAYWRWENKQCFCSQTKLCMTVFMFSYLLLFHLSTGVFSCVFYVLLSCLFILHWVVHKRRRKGVGGLKCRYLQSPQCLLWCYQQVFTVRLTQCCSRIHLGWYALRCCNIHLFTELVPQLGFSDLQYNCLHTWEKKWTSAKPKPQAHWKGNIRKLWQRFLFVVMWETISWLIFEK